MKSVRYAGFPAPGIARLALFGKLILTITALGLFLVILVIAKDSISHNFPTHDREAVEVVATMEIAKGNSPNGLDTFPKNAIGYPLLNHIVNSFLISPNTDFFTVRHLMRTTFWISTFAAVLLLMFVCYREKCPWWLVIFIGTSYLIQQVCFSNEMGSKPGGFGLLLYVLGLTLPFLLRFSRHSWTAGMILIVLASLTKQYFIFAIPVIALYCFVYCDKWQGVRIFAFGCGLLLALLALYEINLPNSIGIMYSPATTIELAEIHNYLWKFWFFLYRFGAYILLGLVPLVTLVYIHRQQIDIPLSARQIPYPLFLTIFLFIIYFGFVIFRIDPYHYYEQQIFGFSLFWSIAISIRSILYSHRFREYKIYFRSTIVILMLLISFGCLVFMTRVTIGRYQQTRIDHSSSWQELRQIIKPLHNVLAFRFLSPILISQGKDYLDSGQLAYAMYVSTPQNSKYLNRLYQDYFTQARTSLTNGDYDALFFAYEQRTGKNIIFAYDRIEEGFEFTDSQLQEMGYYKFYDKRLEGTLISYRITGWKKGLHTPTSK